MVSVREPAVAGQFYEAGAEELIEQIEGAFEHEYGPGEIPDVSSGPPSLLGLVSPHAGYPYSAPIAAHAYGSLARNGTPDTAVIVGPNHGGGGEAVAVTGADRWTTPLGDVPIDQAARDEVLEHSSMATTDEVAHRGEHSIEVQVPFLQYFFADIAILPICLTRQDQEVAEDLGDALGRLLEGSEQAPVLVASTDMTHYQPKSTAEEQDRKAIDRMEALDAKGLLQTVSRERISMCGYGPTAAVIRAGSKAGATEGDLLAYATSGDTAAPTREVVGYCAMAVRS
ncbi:MAG: AmmeMemoRadiSam system protein B [Halodesulfurarchaeum sp.]